MRLVRCFEWGGLRDLQTDGGTCATRESRGTEWFLSIAFLMELCALLIAEPMDGGASRLEGAGLDLECGIIRDLKRAVQ